LVRNRARMILVLPQGSSKARPELRSPPVRWFPLSWLRPTISPPNQEWTSNQAIHDTLKQNIRRLCRLPGPETPQSPGVKLALTQPGRFACLPMRHPAYWDGSRDPRSALLTNFTPKIGCEGYQFVEPHGYFFAFRSEWRGRKIAS
jgi:hypothetical protein